MSNRSPLLGCLTFCLLLFSTLGSAQNLLDNPDFESGELAPWFGDNGSSVSIISDAASGDFAAMGNVAQNVVLIADATYELRCKAKIISVSGTEKVWVGIRSSSGLVTNFKLEEGDWQDVYIEFSAPEDGPHKFWIWGQGSSSYSSDDWELSLRDDPGPGGTDGSGPMSPVADKPFSHPNAPWSFNTVFTDEFNAPSIDQSKWDINPNDWGTWSWEPSNAYKSDTALTLQMVQHTHSRNNQEFYFTSGISRHREKVTYGYFESRIKGTEKGQGTCPAFWLYSRGIPTPSEEGGIQYSEIDVIEINQIANQPQRLEMNLHARVILDGDLTWLRPGQGNEDITRNTWLAPWDPRDQYHVYGVLSRVDSIFWYVDGIQRGAKKNLYWHLPMNPTVSLGLRTPYEEYINGVRTVVPYPDTNPEPGFPTEMYCDYVRAWNTEPQLYADRELYYDARYNADATILFDVRYFAGNDETVVAGSDNGVSCELQEIGPDGSVVQTIMRNDASTVGVESGKVTFSYPLGDLTPTADLPAGHGYVLRPVFTTSLNNGEEVLMAEETYPFTISKTTAVNDVEARENVKVFNTSAGVAVQLNNSIPAARVMVYDLSGCVVYQQEGMTGDNIIDRSNFPATGVYVVSVFTARHQRVEKVMVRR